MLSEKTYGYIIFGLGVFAGVLLGFDIVMVINIFIR